MNYTIYNPTTGEIVSIVGYSSDAEAQNSLVGSSYIDGSYPGTKYYIDVNTQQPVTFPPIPDNTNQYTFDWTTHSWVLNLDATAIQARAQRDMLLSAVDSVNPIWYASLTVEQQTELAAYRTALLNVPQQAGFPTTIEWPTKPTWL
jgi:hypothetical protein